MECATTGKKPEEDKEKKKKKRKKKLRTLTRQRQFFAKSKVHRDPYSFAEQNSVRRFASGFAPVANSLLKRGRAEGW